MGKSGRGLRDYLPFRWSGFYYIYNTKPRSHLQARRPTPANAAGRGDVRDRGRFSSLKEAPGRSTEGQAEDELMRQRYIPLIV